MRILIADDDPTSRLILKAMASKLGHECVVATDGFSAWTMLSSQRIDVLLTDWMMPGLDGPQLCQRVRNELGDNYVYIVMITRLGEPEKVLEGMGAGADDYLIKPVDPFALQARLVAAGRVTVLHQQVADIQIQLEEANLELLGRSLTDALTGLGNRRRMEEDLAGTHAQALRSGRGYGLALFDIDHFKPFNDHYGHLAGDEALRQVARCFENSVRIDERVYRYGGEEFLLLLPNCSAEAAANAARRIQLAVSTAAIPHLARPTQPPRLTLSGGVTHWSPGCALAVDEVIHQADEALFRAKEQGRNRVHAARTYDADLQRAP